MGRRPVRGAVVGECAWDKCSSPATRRLFFGRLDGRLFSCCYCDGHADLVCERFQVEQEERLDWPGLEWEQEVVI